MDLQSKLMDLRNTYSAKRAELAAAQLALNEDNRKIEAMEQRRAKLLADYAQVEASRWDEAAGICPTCHRPHDRVQPRDDYCVKRASIRAPAGHHGNRGRA